MSEKRTLSLTKGDRTYVFNYVPGCESEVFRQAMQLASNPQSGFDMADAAKISFRLAKEVADECYKEVAPPAPSKY